MNWRNLAGLGLAGASVLTYGALFETDRLVGERVTLRLLGWPKHLSGYRVGLVTDFHFRATEEYFLAQSALAWLKEENPDFVVLGGDYVPWWKPDVLDSVRAGLSGYEFFAGRCLAVPGNHDYYGGDAASLQSVFDELGICFLRNEVWRHDGINWVGVDSAGMGHADPYRPLLACEPADPIVVAWHEPDMVDYLPRGVDLMLSGHSHGGQFCTPWGWAPMKTKLGSRYVRGFYGGGEVPIYVSRGLATTGPGARLFCRPEVTVLELISG